MQKQELIIRKKVEKNIEMLLDEEGKIYFSADDLKKHLKVLCDCVTMSDSLVIEKVLYFLTAYEKYFLHETIN
ncbi:MAG: hypothetical protein IT215_00550 [Chitinophagaceae bacterium]|nr:hypothetical protein [Chitinophagaceae bacterium]